MSKDIRFSKTYEYIIVDGDIGTIGISEEASDKLGDIYLVDLPEVGKEFKKDEGIAVIESVKVASDVYTPVSGKVIEINKELENSAELISKSPLEEGWIFKIKIKDKSELESLMDYKEFLKFINA